MAVICPVEETVAVHPVEVPPNIQAFDMVMTGGNAEEYPAPGFKMRIETMVPVADITGTAIAPDP
jgi:hypothetical protein